MHSITAHSVEELQSMLGHYEAALFRGQTRHFETNGAPSVVTSFDRNRCIPSEMLKWTRYAKNVLDTLVRPGTSKSEFNQALLQHYGWRSFYIDCSSNPAVGAWFAAHRYDEQPSLEISEDYQERAVWLRKRMASYHLEEGEGHLYVLDRSVCDRIGLVDLETISIDGARLRTQAQSALLLGPLYGTSVVPECFSAHICADRKIFAQYAAQAGICETDDLFPPPSQDPILKALLGLPWREIAAVRTASFDLPAFRRALELPEYQESLVKIAWPQTAFYQGAKISETFTSVDGDKVGGISIDVPNTVMFGHADETIPAFFPTIENLVAKHGTIILEIDELIQHTNMGGTTYYEKGIAVVPKGEGLFEICALMVRHPGMDMSAAGLNAGWSYRRSAEGLWKREVHPDDCQCGSAAAHLPHLSALKIAEAFLTERSLPESA